MNLIQRIKHQTKDRLIRQGWWKMPSFKAGEGCILMYHGIDLTASTRFNHRFISRDQFEQHLGYFKEHFHVVPVADFVAGERHPNRFTLALSFDDGHRNNYTYAWPLLEKYELPATFYVTGLRSAGEDIMWADMLDLSAGLVEEVIEIEGVSFIKDEQTQQLKSEDGTWLKDWIKSDRKGGYGRKGQMKQALLDAVGNIQQQDQWRDYWELMTGKQISEISESAFVKIGAHGYWHNNLGMIPLEDARQELKQVKTYLEELCPYPIEEIAYPDGSYSRELLDLAETMGYTTQLAVNYRHPEDKEDARIVDRFGIYPPGSVFHQLLQIALIAN